MDKLNNDDSSLERLSRRVYAKGEAPKPPEREALEKKSFNIQGDWTKDPNASTSTAEKPKTPDNQEAVVDQPDNIGSFTNEQSMKNKHHPVLKKFLFFSVAFFVIALGIVSFVLFSGGNTVSSRNVEIAISGPVSTDGGEVLSLQIDVINKNSTTLQVVDLLVEYPEGTRNAEDTGKELVRYRETLGDIKPGKKATQVVEAILFGEEGKNKEINITVEYRVAGSNAIFFKEKKYDVVIQSAPLGLTVSLPNKINVGQEIEAVVDVSSNSESTIEDVIIKAEYPFGFEFIDSTPKPSFGNDTWFLGDMDSREDSTIRIVGKMIGQSDDERVFRFEGGIQSDRDEKEIGTPFISAIKSVLLSKPFVQLDLLLDGKASGEHIVPSGQDVRVEVSWTNNLSVNLSDAVLEVVFSGEAFDKSTVTLQKGFFDSITQKAWWDKRTESKLALVGAGESGSVTLDLSSYDLSSRADISNPEIKIEASFFGNPISGAGDLEKITSVTDRAIKIQSDLLPSSRIVHFVGPIPNSGPMPPRAEQQTTYTVIWSMTNSSNDISRAVMKSVLPPYVRWVGIVSPSTEDISYNSIGGEVVWDVGNVRAGAGVASSPHEVAFQVALVPSVNQIETSPELLRTTTLSGFDNFTRETISNSNQGLTTRITTDPQYLPNHDKVVQ